MSEKMSALRPQALLCLAAFVVSTTCGFSAELALHAQKTDPYDLAVSGELTGVPAGETRWIAWSDLRKLPSTVLSVDNEFVPGRQQVTAVFLKEVWDRLPRGATADAVLADCNDGYASVYRRDYIEKSRPFLVLEINGRGPGEWPPKGLAFNPGPYVISVSDEVVPGVSRQLDVGHKRPWGVTSLRVVNFDRHFASTATGAWAGLSKRAEAGREIWINSCYSCHSGPDNALGGTKAGRPFAVLQTLAAYNKSYFSGYIRAPKDLNPAAKMEPHPHYSDEQIKQIIAFVTAEKAVK